MATAPSGDHDRVVIASRKPDGSPDQTDDFEFIGPKDVVEAQNAEQLKVQKVSAADTAIRGVTSGEAEGSGKEDPTIAELTKAGDSAEAAAVAQAKAEVAEHHQGLGDDSAPAEKSTEKPAK